MTKPVSQFVPLVVVEQKPRIHIAKERQWATNIQDRAVVSMSIVLGALVFVAILALFGYLALQGYVCVCE